MENKAGIGTLLERYVGSTLTFYEGRRLPSNLYERVVSEAEKAVIKVVLERTGFNQVQASKILGINRNTLYAKIKKYRLKTKGEK